MASFTQWYIHNLKARPLLTNLASGVVLMMTGDVMAQSIERKHARGRDDLLETSSSSQSYDTLHSRPFLLPLEKHSALFYSPSDETLNKWRETAEGLQTELAELDTFRLLTMVGWSVFYMTPFFVYFYRFMDKIFPQRTVATIGARVLASFLVSIPTNTLFFMYGTSVNHVAEWTTLREEWRKELQDFGLEESAVQSIMNPGPPLHVEAMVVKGFRKVESELVDTVSVSAKAWMPFNILNFALVPSHLRPLAFSAASVFWNCYLSLAMYATGNPLET